MPEEFDIYVIEKLDMSQDIPANADAFSGSIRTTGHAAAYGIYFDSGRWELKPESDAALDEIADLLEQEPGLRLNVVGHTDNQGGMDYLIKLGQSRAETVVQALVSRYRMTPDRLKGYGVGAAISGCFATVATYSIHNRMGTASSSGAGMTVFELIDVGMWRSIRFETRSETHETHSNSG